MTERINPDEKPCSLCGNEPRVEGQRWGLRCRAEYMRNYRRRHIEIYISQEELEAIRKKAGDQPVLEWAREQVLKALAN